jgi:hypothetical protein
MENQTVAQKLEALVKLQSIDSKLDELKKLTRRSSGRGSRPGG